MNRDSVVNKKENLNMNIEYEIKYLNGDDVLKLEKYLQDVAKHQSGVDYFFKFSPDRTEVSVKDKNGMINVKFSLRSGITETITDYLLLGTQNFQT
jgi:hypothetical protein